MLVSASPRAPASGRLPAPLELSRARLLRACRLLCLPLVLLLGLSCLLGLTDKPNGHPTETCFNNQVTSPDGTKADGEYCLRAKKALYGLPQAPRLWNNTLKQWFLKQGFVQCKKDPCVYRLKTDLGEINLIVYVDDIAFAGSNPEMIAAFKRELSSRFDMKDLGLMRWFLGMHIEQDIVNRTLKITQGAYVRDMLKRFTFMDDIPPAPTPASESVKLTRADCPIDPELANKSFWWRPYYRSVVGSLLYAQSGCRPELSNAVSKLSSFLENPGPAHWNEAVRSRVPQGLPRQRYHLHSSEARVREPAVPICRRHMGGLRRHQEVHHRIRVFP